MVLVFAVNGVAILSQWLNVPTRTHSNARKVPQSAQLQPAMKIQCAMHLKSMLQSARLLILNSWPKPKQKHWILVYTQYCPSKETLTSYIRRLQVTIFPLPQLLLRINLVWILQKLHNLANSIQQSSIGKQIFAPHIMGNCMIHASQTLVSLSQSMLYKRRLEYWISM